MYISRKKQQQDIIIAYVSYFLLLTHFWFFIFILKLNNTLFPFFSILSLIILLIPTLIIIKQSNESFLSYYGEAIQKQTLLKLALLFITGISLFFLKGQNNIAILKIVQFFFVAFVEEYIFRGFFQIRLTRFFSSQKAILIKAMLIQSLLFTFTHIFTNVYFENIWPAFLMQFILALLFTFLRIWSRDLSIPIALHWFLNAMQIH